MDNRLFHRSLTAPIDNIDLYSEDGDSELEPSNNVESFPLKTIETTWNVRE